VRRKERATDIAVAIQPSSNPVNGGESDPQRSLLPVSHPSPPPVSPRRKLTATDLKKRFRLDEFLAENLVTSVAFISLATIVLIFAFVFKEAVPIFFGKASHSEVMEHVEEEDETYGEEFLGAAGSALDRGGERSRAAESAGSEGEASLGNLLSTEWQPVSGDPKYGLLPLVLGSLKVTLIAIFLASPLAILAALFTSSFAPKRVREFLKPAIELLAGFPSVVIGFFALVTLATLMQKAFGLPYRLNALVGGVAMALAVIPIVYTIAEDALTAVPRFMTEASLALGATKWQTAIFVTLPAATPGVFAAILLGFGRAFGETMIVLMATGNAALMGWSLIEPVRTMSATIGAEMAEVVFGETHYHVLFLIGAILFIFTFTLNAVAEVFIRERLLKRFRGEAT
jgi:phosphate transport system permease protein